MKWNKKTNDALRILIYLEYHETFLTSHDLASALLISQKSVIETMSVLHAAGFVYCKTGRNGGYCISTPASNILLYDVVEALDPTFFSSLSTNETEANGLEFDFIAILLDFLQDSLINVLKSYSIHDFTLVNNSSKNITSPINKSLLDLSATQQ